MKTFVKPSTNYTSLQSSLLKLVPPPTHKITLVNKNGFIKGLKDAVCKYTIEDLSVASLLHTSMIDLPFQQPLYSDFLIHAKGLHQNEPNGLFMLLYKHVEEGTSVDVIISPISFFKLAKLNEQLAEGVHRMANLWYGNDDGLTQQIPNWNVLVNNNNLHKHLMPVGVLVQKTDSSYLSKLTTVNYGPLYCKNYKNFTNLIIPKDLFVDLDDWANHSMHIFQPSSGIACYYLTLVYVIDNGQTKPMLLFFRTLKGEFEVMSLLKLFFEDLIINKFEAYVDVLNINVLKFGVVCKIGQTSSRTLSKQTTLYYRGSSLLVYEISDFIVDYTNWKILI